MISKKDLEVLRAYRSRGHTLLSVYLRLDSAAGRQGAYQQFVRLLRACLNNHELPPMCPEIIQEDIEIVSLYLTSNANHPGAGLAIFSCACELFWRAYSLPILIPSRVAVGPRFDIEPLLQVAAPQVQSEFGSIPVNGRSAFILS